MTKEKTLRENNKKIISKESMRRLSEKEIGELYNNRKSFVKKEKTLSERRKYIKEWIKKKNKEDVKNKINPIYSIKTGSEYASEELFEDVEELMIAVGETFFEKGIKEFIKEILEGIENWQTQNSGMEANIITNTQINNLKQLIKQKAGDLK